MGHAVFKGMPLGDLPTEASTGEEIEGTVEIQNTDWVTWSVHYLIEIEIYISKTQQDPEGIIRRDGDVWPHFPNTHRIVVTMPETDIWFRVILYEDTGTRWEQVDDTGRVMVDNPEYGPPPEPREWWYRETMGVERWKLIAAGAGGTIIGGLLSVR